MICASAEDGGRTLDEIHKGTKSNSKNMNLGFTEEMMVFCGMLPDTLDKFLESYKKQGIQPVLLKAVLTMYNAKWTPLKLKNELAKERETLSR